MSQNSGPHKQFVQTNEEIIADLTRDLQSSLIQDSNSETVVPDQQFSGKSSDRESDSFTNYSNSNCDTAHTNEEASDIQEEPGVSGCGSDKEATRVYTEEEKKELKTEAEQLKSLGNDLFRAGNYEESVLKYTEALDKCPTDYKDDRAILYANRAAANVNLGLVKEVIEDCSKSIELKPDYVKALLRRAQAYEKDEKLDEAFADYKAILTVEPGHTESMRACSRLPYEIEQRNEKMKTEMFAKLKDLGNMILRPFNLSTDNFQVNKDPNTGGYSINFNQKPQ